MNVYKVTIGSEKSEMYTVWTIEASRASAAIGKVLRRDSNNHNTAKHVSVSCDLIHKNMSYAEYNRAAFVVEGITRHMR